MLTETEMQEYIDMAERDEWDPKRWRFNANPHKNPTLFIVDVDERQMSSLESRARERGQDSSEYLNNLVNSVLAAV